MATITVTLTADDNLHGQINGHDVVELRKYILGVYAKWPYESPVVYFINGEVKPKILFSGSDFPLSLLNIQFPSAGSVYTN